MKITPALLTTLISTPIAEEPNSLTFGPLAVPGSAISIQVEQFIGAPLLAKVIFVPADETQLEQAALAFAGRRVTFGLRHHPQAQFSGVVQANPVCIFDRGVIELTIRGHIAKLNDCPKWRTFANQTTQQILQFVLTEAGINPVFRTTPGQNHSFCLQSGESDLVFVRRLCADEGWEIDDEGHIRSVPHPGTVETIPMKNRRAATPGPGLETLRMEPGRETTISASGDILIRVGDFFRVPNSLRVFRATRVVISALEGNAGRQESWACAIEAVAVSPKLQVPSSRLTADGRSAPTTLVGTVVGPDGKEQQQGAPAVHPTQRVRVRFDWDPKDDLTRAPLVPLAASWPGLHAWPRCGDRVMVDFENGDFRKPRITSVQMPEQDTSIVDDADAITLSTAAARGTGSQSGVASTLRLTPVGTSAGIGIQSAGRMTQKIARSHRTAVGKAQSTRVGGNRFEQIGGSAFTSVDEEIVITAGRRITFRVGGSIIVISEDGITVNGKKVYLNSPGGPQPGESKPPEDIADLPLRSTKRGAT